MWGGVFSSCQCSFYPVMAKPKRKDWLFRILDTKRVELLIALGDSRNRIKYSIFRYQAGDILGYVLFHEAVTSAFVRSVLVDALWRGPLRGGAARNMQMIMRGEQTMQEFRVCGVYGANYGREADYFWYDPSTESTEYGHAVEQEFLDFEEEANN
jgi:hypothetical protein